MSSHYQNENPAYEAIHVIQAWELSFPLGCVLKYIARAGKKPGNTRLADLKKARDYINYEIAWEESKQALRGQTAPAAAPAPTASCDHQWEYKGAGQGGDEGEHYHQCELCHAWDVSYDQ